MQDPAQVQRTLSKEDHAQLRHVWTITGPAGCGKSTVAVGLSQRLGLPFIEGDEYHPAANIEKMASGRPLDDEDRWDWLILLREEAVKRLSSPEAGDRKAPSATWSSTEVQPPKTGTEAPELQPSHTPGVILTCSALKRKYRDVLRGAIKSHPDVRMHFVYLRASEAETLERVRARQGHYMKEEMVTSQFASLEEPEADETDCVVVDVTGTSKVDDTVDKALAKVKEAVR